MGDASVNRRSGGTKASAKSCLQTAVAHHLKVLCRKLKKTKAASSIRKNSNMYIIPPPSNSGATICQCVASEKTRYIQCSRCCC